MRRMIMALCLSALTLPLLAVPLDRSVQWYAQPGLHQHATIEQAMLVKRHPMRLLALPDKQLGSAQKAWPRGRVKIVDSCQDYLHYMHRNYAPATPLDLRLADDYERVCSTLSYLLHAKEAHDNHILATSLLELGPTLPAALLSSPGEDADVAGSMVQHCPDTRVIKTLANGSQQVSMSQRYAITMYSKQCASYARIQMLAQGDINHDGNQDLLVEVYRWNDQADYHGQEVVVLSKASVTAPVRSIPWRAVFVDSDDGD